MLKNLIIQLSDNSASFCHYPPGKSEALISLNQLSSGLIWAIKRSLNIQVAYPPFTLPIEYCELLDTFPHSAIVAGAKDINVSTVVFDGWDFDSKDLIPSTPVVIRTTLNDFIINLGVIESMMVDFTRINIIITDIWNFDDIKIGDYKTALSRLSEKLVKAIKEGIFPQINIITDRMLLRKMNNCNAGVESITLAPDGKFYICPGFYLDGESSVGSPETGLMIPNRQLYRLDHSPICRICDAFNCKRCVWLNKKLTMEVNTPSHQQCVVAHIEREAGRKLLDKIREYGSFAPNVEIPSVSYLDPFYKLIKQANNYE